MPVERFLPDVARIRRGAGWVLMTVSALPLAWVVSRVIAVGQVNGGALFLFIVLGGLFGLGIRFAFHPVEYLEIDTESRTFRVFRKGLKIGDGGLDDLGPLEVIKRTRQAGTSSKPRTVTEFVVRAAVHKDIDLYALKSPGKARQQMESLARAWNLSCQSWGGAVRAAGTLDTPLHERMRGDGAARKPMPLQPAWGVRIEPAPMGYALISTHRSYAPLISGSVTLVVVLFILRGPILALSPEMMNSDDPMGKVLMVIAGVGGLGLLWLLYKGIRDTFFPGTVHIDDSGVSYRGRSLRFRHIEEIIATSPIEIVGDRGIIRLGETFCPIPATDAVVHELQRLIVEVAASHEGISQA